MYQTTADFLRNKVQTDYQTIEKAFDVSRKQPWLEFAFLLPYLKQNATVLDVGCGNGRLLLNIQGKNVSYVGLDSNEYFIQQANKQFGNGHNEFMVADALKPYLTARMFDVVASIAVLHHIPSKDYQAQFVHELTQHIAPGGILFLTCWNLWQFRYIWSVIKYKQKRLFGQKLAQETKGKLNGRDLDANDVFMPFEKQGAFAYRYVHAFTKKELVNLIQNEGLEILSAFYSDGAKKVGRFRGKNIVIIAKKR